MCRRATVPGSFVTGRNDLFHAHAHARPGRECRAVLSTVTGWARARRAPAVAVRRLGCEICRGTFTRA